ncbi:MAG: sulfatase-like hydrolase/transferase [Phycisphaeraceae bacterium]|nr:sulfatase-like hydrolase/transferase [Phycisphaeraceae bacterium]
MTKRPHIVIFNPDEWRGDVLGHMGNPAAVTPNLDAFAKTEAVSFRHAFCQQTICTPSRCSFMTGWYPHVRGHRTGSYMLRPDEPCLLGILKDHGYHVAWSGKNDLVPAQHGFDRHCHVKFHQTDADIQRWGHRSRVSDWPWPTLRGRPGDDTFYSFFVGKLDKQDQSVYLDQDWCWLYGALDLIHARPADQPLCLFVALSYPHPPYQVEEPYFSMIDRGKLLPRLAAPDDWTGKPSILPCIHQRLNMQTWTEPRWDELRAAYYGMCARVDAQFGLLVQALREAGMYDDTAIFFLSDHGDFAGDWGLVEKTSNTFEDCLTRVPLLVKPPRGMACKPGVSDSLAELVDLPATIYDLTGIDPGYTHFGRSLLPVVRGETQDHRDAVFAEGGRLRGEKPGLELAHNPQHDPHDAYWPRFDCQRSDYRKHGKATMCRTRQFKFVHRLYESDELYDLQRDPHEQHNVRHTPAYAGVVAEMKDRLLRFYLETGDAPPFDADDRWPGHNASATAANAPWKQWD